MNLPEKKIATLLNDTFNAHVSVGTVVDYLKKAAELFGDEYERIKREMRKSQICNYPGSEWTGGTGGFGLLFQRRW
ncbi:MAG: hypothetical protein ACXQT5_03590 [Candidatus Syntropharchaeia archaeon]